MSVLRAEIERVYAAIWEHLDDAATKTRAASRSTAAYATLRSSIDASAAIANVNEKYAGMDPGFTRVKATFELTVRHNQEGIEQATRAIAALQDVWPDLDWRPVEQPEVDLRPRGLLSRLFGRK